MKFGIRKPSLTRSISARTTGQLKRAINRAVNPYYGKKGVGIFILEKLFTTEFIAEQPSAYRV